MSWTGPAEALVSWTEPAEASVSWTKPAEASVSWTGPAEASMSWMGSAEVLHPRTCLSGSVPFCVCALFVLLIFCLSHPLSNVDKDYQVEFN